MNDDLNLTDDERPIYSILSKTKAMPISEIMASDQIIIGKSKVTEILKRLDGKKLIVVERNGRGTKYKRTSR